MTLSSFLECFIINESNEKALNPKGLCVKLDCDEDD